MTSQCFTSAARFILVALAALVMIQTSAKADAANPDPLRFENEIKEFEEADRKQFPAAGGALFYGSSSFRMWKTMENDFAPLPVIRRGFGGSHMSDAVFFASRAALPYKPKVEIGRAHV